MTEEIIIDKEDKTKKHRNNEIDCLHFGCRKGESGNVLFWCHFYDDHCDNYTGCYYRKYLRLEQENKALKDNNNHLQVIIDDGRAENKRLREENKELKSETLQWKQIKDMANNNKYRSVLEEIREICKCSKSPINCDKCPQNDDCEELCVNDENLQDIIYDKITEVLDENN